MTRLRKTTALAAAALALVLAAGSAAKPSATKTIVVDTFVDVADTKPVDGKCIGKLKSKSGHRCSLRAAIQTANYGPRGSYVIKLPAGTFHLSAPGKYEGKAAKGDLDILQANVTVIGQGPGKTTIDGGGIDRVFDVSAFAGLTAQGLRITGGKTSGFKPGEDSGGSIRVRGVLKLQNVLVDSNNAGVKGGGLYVDSTGGADLEEVTLAHNVAWNGAGIYVDGHASLTNVTIAGNNASTSGGGLEVAGLGGNGKASLLHVTIAGNTAPSTNGSAATFGGTYTMRSSIVTGTCQQPTGAHFPSPQHNVITDKYCGDDPPVADAGLLTLAAEGDAVPTIGLKPTSPAIDFAFSNTCPKVDARGVKRPQGAGCDSGAYELVKG